MFLWLIHLLSMVGAFAIMMGVKFLAEHAPYVLAILSGLLAAFIVYVFASCLRAGEEGV